MPHCPGTASRHSSPRTGPCSSSPPTARWTRTPSSPSTTPRPGQGPRCCTYRRAPPSTLLAQFGADGDARTTWGDEGTLYWLIRAEDLAARRFDQARLTVQS
ncbi:DUF1963 domain-containing protein [Streptomyces sp. MNU76]|uniref:DUF1963 domain-containing protein n=1 Tax=Streptomyces sp. MNU76 TaxID=2560026 RepID=UPI001E396AA5|nr:DUF1963 domain-containing protein [Streptomyces sp. MNU76]MCC9711456.1 DUF1963 domain-containing protein [Streptomyces sp. MNU76]